MAKGSKYHRVSWAVGVAIGQLKVSVTQSCPTLCDPVDCRPPGSSVHGILQARIREWVPIHFPRGSVPVHRLWVPCFMHVTWTGHLFHITQSFLPSPLASSWAPCLLILIIVKLEGIWLSFSQGHHHTGKQCIFQPSPPYIPLTCHSPLFWFALEI